MSENRNSMSGVTKVILVLALIIVVWNLYTGVKIQEVGIPGLFTIKFGDRNETPAPTPAVALTVTPTKTPAPPTHTPPPTPTRLPTETPVPKPSLIKENYLVDNRQNWIIVVTQLGDTSYRIEDPGSPWPWEGTATIDGGKLSGEARFRNSLTTMRVEGIVRGDGTIKIQYEFITDSKGNPSDRIDYHTWYPTKYLITENYLVDNQQNWIIVVTQLGDTSYRIEDPGSPWPWEGTATIDGGKLSGEARFRNSLATMRVEGIVRGDGTIEIEYKFITDGKGNPSERRIDPHTWYPTK